MISRNNSFIFSTADRIDRLNSPQGLFSPSALFSPQAPTPQNCFKLNEISSLKGPMISGDEIDRKLRDMKNSIRMNERKPNLEVDDTQGRGNNALCPSPRSAFQRMN